MHPTVTALLTALKAHPATLNALEGIVHAQVDADPAFLADLVTAAEGNTWAAFALQHFAFVAQVVGCVAQNADLLKAVGDLLPKSLTN